MKLEMRNLSHSEGPGRTFLAHLSRRNPWSVVREFEILPPVSMVTDRIMMKKKTVSPLFLGCFSSVSFHICR